MDARKKNTGSGLTSLLCCSFVLLDQNNGITNIKIPWPKGEAKPNNDECPAAWFGLHETHEETSAKVFESELILSVPRNEGFSFDFDGEVE